MKKPLLLLPVALLMCTIIIHSSEFSFVGSQKCRFCHRGKSKGDVYEKWFNGLITPDENVCKKCRNERSKDFKGFDYKEYLKKIDHTYKEK